MSLRALALATLAGVSLAPPVLGQPATAVVEGTVKDEGGGILPGTIVSVANVETGWTAGTATSPRGTYRIAAIPPGSYRLSAELAGFPRHTREGIRLFVGQAVVITLTMKMGPREEAITVNAEAPLVSIAKSEIGQAVEPERIEQLPLDGRNFLELAELAPGVAPSTGFGGGLTSINGFSFRNVAVNLDGVDQTDVVARGAYGYFTSEPVREFQVITNRFSAEYGNSLSGVINAVTKSGTNEFHGTAYIYARDESLDARRQVFDYETLGFKPEEEKDEFSQQQFGGSLGGPIVKDKTHFFANYERGNHDATAFVTVNPAWSLPNLDISREVGNFPQTSDDRQFFAKVNHQLSRRHALEASYTYKKSDDGNVFVGGFSTQSFGAHTEFRDNVLLLSDTFTISSRALNQFRFQLGRRRNDWIPNDPSPSVYQYTNFGVITCCGSHPSVSQDNYTRRIEFKDDFNLNLSRHSLKFGGDLQLLYGDHDTRYTSTGFYVVWYGSPLYFRQAFGPTHFTFNEEVYGLYAQDDWRVRDNLTLNLGVRWDYNSFTPDDHDNIAPRLGFAWDPWKDGRTSVRGGSGLYHDLAFTQLLQVANWGGQEGAYNLTFAPSDPLYPQGWGTIPGLPAGRPIPARDIWVLDPNLRTGQSWQSSLGFSRELTRDLAVSIDGVYVKGKHLLRLRDLNAPVFRGPYPAGQEVTLANRNRPVPPVSNGFRRIDQMESTGRSEYKGLYLSVTKRVKKGHTFQVSYTLASARDDLPVGGDYNSRPNDSLDMDAEWGRALNDIQHTVAANGLLQLPWGFSTGGIFLAYSGRPFTAQAGYDRNGDGIINDRPPGVGKGTLEGDGFSKLDLFLAKTFSFSQRYRLMLRAECFNVFDTLNTTGFGTIVGTGTFEKATSAFAPRSFQLSTRFSF